MWMGIGSPQGNKTNELNTSLARGGGISGFSNSPSQTEQLRAQGNTAWNTSQNAVNQTGQFDPQALAQGKAAGSNALSVQNAGQRAAQTGQRPMGTPGTAEISAAANGQSQAMGGGVAPPPVDPGVHRPAGMDNSFQGDQDRVIQNGMLNGSNQAGPGVGQALNYSLQAEDMGGVNPATQSPASAQQSPNYVASPQSPGALQSMGSAPTIPSTDLFGRPQYI